MTDDLSDIIKENAQKPQSASGDGISASQHSLSDQIAADKYLAAKKAARNPASALKIARVIPPGAV